MGAGTPEYGPPRPGAAGADTSTSVCRAPTGIFNCRLCRLARGECPSPALCPGQDRIVQSCAGPCGTQWRRMGPCETE